MDDVARVDVARIGAEGKDRRALRAPDVERSAALGVVALELEGNEAFRHGDPAPQPVLEMVEPVGALEGLAVADRAGRIEHAVDDRAPERRLRSEEHTAELQSIMRPSYAVLCLNKNNDTCYF